MAEAKRDGSANSTYTAGDDGNLSQRAQVTFSLDCHGIEIPCWRLSVIADTLRGIQPSIARGTCGLVWRLTAATLV